VSQEEGLWDWAVCWMEILRSWVVEIDSDLTTCWRTAGVHNLVRFLEWTFWWRRARSIEQLSSCVELGKTWLLFLLIDPRLPRWELRTLCVLPLMTWSGGSSCLNVSSFAWISLVWVTVGSCSASVWLKTISVSRLVIVWVSSDSPSVTVVGQTSLFFSGLPPDLLSRGWPSRLEDCCLLVLSFKDPVWVPGRSELFEAHFLERGS
jgi:hypothetical protein